MAHGLTFQLSSAELLTSSQRAEIISLCSTAYEEKFADLFDLLPGSTHVLARRREQLVSHAAWVTRWLQPEGRELLRTAYVEAVATAPAYQRRGYGTLVMKELMGRISGYDMGALSPSDAAFYERLGWELWRGPLAIRTEDELIPTSGEEVMILRLEATPALELNSQLTAEWRVGELW